jgi:flagellar hook-associated protein 3
MLTAQVIQNLGRNLERFARIEEKLSSARRINRPSDDPIGTVRVLEYRHQLEAIEQYQKDVQFGQSWLSTTDSALANVDNLLIEAFDIVVNLSNDTIPDDQRDSLAGRVSAIIDQVLESANAKSSGRYIFSGTLTDQAAIVASSSGVVFNGNTDAIRTKIGDGTYIDLNSLGNRTFTQAFMTLGEEFDLEAAINAATPLADLHGGTGVQTSPGLFQIADRNGVVTAFVNVSGATTVGDVVATINATLAGFGMGNVTASIGPTGDGIRLEATPTGIVSGTTLLTNLNAGRGVDANPGQFVMHKTDGSADVVIDLTGAVTVQDAITAFNAEMNGQGFGTVSMSLRADNLGLQITDTGIPPHGFEVQEITGADTTAADLGLSGPVNALLVGAELQPQPDYEVLEFGAGFTIAEDLGILGRFQGTFDGEPLDPLLTTATAVSRLNNGLGLELGRVHIASGDRTAIVDLSTATTIGEVLSLLNATGLPVEARINDASTGIEIYSTVDDRSLIVTSDTLRTAEKLGIVGSPDLFGSLYLLRQALEENSGELVRTTNQSIQGALDQILFERSTAGSRQIRLEATGFRLIEQELNVTRLRSEYEDADILALSSDLTKQEAVYQAALAAAARMIQPSLAQFLR